MDCKKEKNEKECTCPSEECENHGLCCACVRRHRKKGDLPNCLRKSNGK